MTLTPYIYFALSAIFALLCLVVMVQAIRASYRIDALKRGGGTRLGLPAFTNIVGNAIGRRVWTEDPALMEARDILRHRLLLLAAILAVIAILAVFRPFSGA